MAIAEGLKAAHDIDIKIEVVGDKVKGVGDRVNDVGNGVKDVGDKIAGA